MIKGINLIPDEVQRERLLRKRGKALAAGAVVCLVLLVLIYIGQRSDVNYRRTEAQSAAAADESLSYTGVLPADRDKKF